MTRVSNTLTSPRTPVTGANFIINDGGASAADLEKLIEFVRGTVREEQGVELHTEVRIVGDKR